MVIIFTRGVRPSVRPSVSLYIRPSVHTSVRKEKQAAESKRKQLHGPWWVTKFERILLLLLLLFLGASVRFTFSYYPTSNLSRDIILKIPEMKRIVHIHTWFWILCSWDNIVAIKVENPKNCVVVYVWRYLEFLKWIWYHNASYTLMKFIGRVSSLSVRLSICEMWAKFLSPSCPLFYCNCQVVEIKPNSVDRCESSNTCSMRLWNIRLTTSMEGKEYLSGNCHFNLIILFVMNNNWHVTFWATETNSFLYFFVLVKNW